MARPIKTELFLSEVHDDNPLTHYLYNDEGLSDYAARAALYELAGSWGEDHGMNREFMVGSLDHTIAILNLARRLITRGVQREDLKDDAALLLAEGDVDAAHACLTRYRDIPGDPDATFTNALVALRS